MNRYDFTNLIQKIDRFGNIVGADIIIKVSNPEKSNYTQVTPITSEQLVLFLQALQKGNVQDVLYPILVDASAHGVITLEVNVETATNPREIGQDFRDQFNENGTRPILDEDVQRRVEEIRNQG